MKHSWKQILARKIASDIFRCGDELGQVVHRIQFVGGSSDNERPQGGLGKEPLAELIEKSISEVLDD